ncbi:hypothetical protein GCM10027589_20350 [Actinocorallia lasiicapitis]
MRNKLWRTGRVAMVAALAFTGIVFGTGAAHADGTPPPLQDGFGLQVVSVQGGGFDFSVNVQTSQVDVSDDYGSFLGYQKPRIRVHLPATYYSEPGKRWPVAYFLHGGPGNADDLGGIPALHSDKMITVAPDGGRKGWYTDWLMQNTAEGAAKWETFHIQQVIPFIDANLRTLTDRGHRAITGLSMGGYGSLHYAEAHPDLFGHVVSMSGAVDLNSTQVRAVILATELNLPTLMCSGAAGCNYGPTVDSDAIFGTPYFWGDWRWKAADPASLTNLQKLSNTTISLYTGNNDMIEQGASPAYALVNSRLAQLGIPVQRYWDYGNGSALSPNCNGGHNYPCWQAAFADYVPRLEANFAAAN